MFGYVKAELSKLSEENVENYKNVYCSLCFSLKKNYGISSRFLLNYDVTFLALLLLNDREQKECEEKFCPYKFKKCRLIKNEEVFFYCASVLIILAFEKILDNIRDEKFFKKILYMFLKLIFKRKYLKAKKNYPVLSDKIRQNMISQSNLEKDSVSIDKAAHPSADSLGIIFESFEGKKELYRFGYMLGRWIYFIDAADDLQDDIKTGSFNPFKSGFEPEKIEGILNLTIGEACESYEQLQKGSFSPVIENIIYEGSLSAQRKVFDSFGIEEGEAK